jgi:hypothetical protein
MSLDVEKCERCGKVISSRAKANVLNDEILCTPCWNKLAGKTSPTRPATPKQLDFLRSLGFSDVDAFTFDQASYTLDRAQQVRYLSFQVARQEWRKDLSGYDLRPIVHAAFADPMLLEQIYDKMQRHTAATYARQEELQAAQLRSMDPNGRIRDSAGRFTPLADISLRDCAPDLERDLTYCKIRDGLLAIFGESVMMDQTGAVTSWHQTLAMRLGQGIRKLMSPDPKPVVPEKALSKKCPSCGAALGASAKICGVCGTAQSVPLVPPSPPTHGAA